MTAVRESAVRRQGARRLGAVALGLIVGCALLELGSRALLPAPRTHSTRALELDTGLGFRGVPHHRSLGRDALGEFEAQWNEDGFRGPSLPSERPAAGSIVLLGDSFVVAEALRDAHRLRSRLAAERRAVGDPRPVVELATIDYGTGQELATLRRFSERTAPSAIVLVMYPANDLVNNTLSLAGTTAVSGGDFVRPYWPREGDRGTAVIAARPRFTHPVRAFLRHSRVFATLELAALGAARERGFRWLEPFPAQPSIATRIRNGLAPRADWEIFRRHDPGDPWEEAWRTTFAQLDALRDDATRLGARLLIVVVPSAEQVQRTPRALAHALLVRALRGRAMSRDLDWNLPEARLATFLANRQVDAVWVLPILRRMAAEAPVYTPDEHLGTRAHAELARRVSDWISGASPEALSLVGSQPFDPFRAMRAEQRSGTDFLAHCERAAVGAGFLDWDPASGWSLGQSGLLVLPGPKDPGDLSPLDPAGQETRFFVRGEWRADGATTRAGSLEFELPGAAPVAHRLDAPGSFAIDVTLDAAPLRIDGFTSLVIRRAGLGGVVRISGVGFGAERQRPLGARRAEASTCPDATAP